MTAHQSPEQLKVIASLLPEEIKAIDALLMAQLDNIWRKSAYVVGMAMFSA